MKITLEEFYQLNRTRASLTDWLKANGFRGWPYADVDWANKTVFFTQR